jgi:hypothetical protein
VIVFHARQLQPRDTGDFDAKQFAGGDLDASCSYCRYIRSSSSAAGL